jgi:hypothetical protein
MGKSMQSKVLTRWNENNHVSEQEANTMYPKCRSC